VTLYGDCVAQRLEQPPEEGFAAATGQHGQRSLERQRRFGQLRPFLAPAGQGAAEHLGDCHAQEGGGDVRAVVDVLFHGAPLAGRPAAVADQPNRIDIQQQGGRAAVRVGLGVNDVGLAEGERERLAAGRVLVQEVAEVGRRPVRRCDRQEHRGLAAPGRWEQSIKSTAP
jgi:hypothetical protein